MADNVSKMCKIDTYRPLIGSHVRSIRWYHESFCTAISKFFPLQYLSSDNIYRLCYF